MVDVKKLLESAQRAAEAGVDRPWTASNVRVGGVDFGTVQTTGREDTLDFIEAMKAADEMVAKAWAGTPKVPQHTASEPASPLLSEEIANHLNDLERRQLAADTITESKHTLRIFAAVVGNLPVWEIKATHVRAFLDAVRWWPERATIRPKYRHMSVLEIIDVGKRENVPAPSKHTLNKHNQRLGVFLNGLVALDLLSKNPLKAIKPDSDTSTDLDTGRPFTPDELCAMFEPARFTAWAAQSPHRWWGSMLGLYTGARVNEIAQICVDDVQEVNGVWGVFFWKNTRGQKIKNRSSIRFVPIAKPLLDARFLDFLADMRECGHPRLFPHLPAGTKKDGAPNGKGYGRQLSRQFGAYMKTLGIEKGTAFHSFRHTLSTSLAEAGVSSPAIAQITGHAVSSQVPTLEKHYIHIAQTATLSMRLRTLGKFKPGVDLPQYQRGQFADALGKRSQLHP
ncbi:MAG: site-specific integrase [Pseudomonadota bacterium]